MDFKPEVEKKNPLFWGLVFAAIGIAASITGWLFWESTIKAKADAAGWILFPGLAVLILGAYKLYKGSTK